MKMFFVKTNGGFPVITDLYFRCGHGHSHGLEISISVKNRSFSTNSKIYVCDSMSRVGEGLLSQLKLGNYL